MLVHHTRHLAGRGQGAKVGSSLSKDSPALDGDASVVERQVCVAGPLRAPAMAQSGRVVATLIGLSKRGRSGGASAVHGPPVKTRSQPRGRRALILCCRRQSHCRNGKKLGVHRPMEQYYAYSHAPDHIRINLQQFVTSPSPSRVACTNGRPQEGVIWTQNLPEWDWAANRLGGFCLRPSSTVLPRAQRATASRLSSSTTQR